MKVKKRNNKTPEQKAELVKRYRKLKADGVAAQQAAAKLGLPYITLRTWEKQQQENAEPVPLTKSKGPLVLHTPAGHRVEFSRIEDLIQVLKAIG